MVAFPHWVHKRISARIETILEATKKCCAALFLCPFVCCRECIGCVCCRKDEYVVFYGEDRVPNDPGCCAL